MNFKVMFAFIMLIMLLPTSHATIIETGWPVENIDISNRTLVWAEYYSPGSSNIWYMNLDSGVKHIVKYTPDWDDKPKIYGDWIVFQSSKNAYLNESKRDQGDVIAYNIKSKVWLEVANSSAYERDPDIWKDLVAYIVDNYEIVVYNLTLRKSIANLTLDKNTSINKLSIYGNFVAFDVGLASKRLVYLWNISDGSVKQIDKKPSMKYYVKIWGNSVYWYDETNYRIYNYNIVTDSLKALNWTGTVRGLDVYGENLVLKAYVKEGDWYIRPQVFLYNTYYDEFLQLTKGVSKYYPAIGCNKIAYNYDVYYIQVIDLKEIPNPYMDSDCDGFIDKHEKTIGTDPYTPNDFFDYVKIPSDDSRVEEEKENPQESNNTNDNFLDQLLSSETSVNLSILYVKVNGKRVELLKSNVTDDLVALNITEYLVSNKSNELKIFVKLRVNFNGSSEDLSVEMYDKNGELGNRTLEVSPLGIAGQTQIEFNLNNSDIVFFKAKLNKSTDLLVFYLFKNDDEDGDGLGVKQEFVNGTLPFTKDSDEDGLDDALDPDPINPEENTGNIEAFRDLPPIVNQNEIFNVTLSLNANGYAKIKEIFPQEFQFVRYTVSPKTNSTSINVTGNTILISWSGSVKVIYQLRSPQTNGTFNFSIVASNATIAGDRNVTVGEESGQPQTQVGKQPVANFTILLLNGQSATFDASSSYDPDGSIVSYKWNFGDGNSETTTSPTIQHTYSQPGNYTITLTVTDNDCLSSTLTKTIHVEEQIQKQLKEILSLILQYLQTQDIQQKQQLKQQILQKILQYLKLT